jgi:hypothetical protein
VADLCRAAVERRRAAASENTAPEVEESRAGLHGVREEMFAKVRALYDAGETATGITK